MAFALVYTGEHYVFDVLLGWLYTVIAVLAGQRLLVWWAARRASGDHAPGGEPALQPAKL
jgi:uncharacterized membrane protein YdjX (TVP38/TMEM64 family)